LDAVVIDGSQYCGVDWHTIEPPQEKLDPLVEEWNAIAAAKAAASAAACVDFFIYCM